MNNIFEYLSKNIVSAILVTVLTGITVTTSAAGTAKLLGSINSFKPSVPEVQDVKTIENNVPTPTVKTNETKTGNIISNTIKKIAAVISPTPSSSGNNTAQNNNTCIITLFGKQYDVFSLQNTHSGGNVFTCNSDMTSIYQGQHGNDVSRMQKYLVTSTGTTNSNSGSSTVTGSGPSSTSVNKDDDTDNDREDNEGKERVEKKEDNETEVDSDSIQLNK